MANVRSFCEANAESEPPTTNSLTLVSETFAIDNFLQELTMKNYHDYLERCTSLAIMGGTFDPIHNGHLAIAEAVLYHFKPQRVLFIPAGAPPHKPDKPITCGEHRYQMILQSISKIPRLDVSRLEIDRPGASYTIDTLREIRAICPADSVIYFVIGQDALEAIFSWKDAEKLLTICQFIAVPRPGQPLEQLHTQIEHLKKTYGTTIHLLDCPLLEVSGTYIRECFAKGKSVSALMPHGAFEYAKENGVYRPVMPDLLDKF